MPDSPRSGDVVALERRIQPRLKERSRTRVDRQIQIRRGWQPELVVPVATFPSLVEPQSKLFPATQDSSARNANDVRIASPET